MYRLDLGYTTLKGILFLKKHWFSSNVIIRLVYLHNPVVDQV